VEPCPSNSFPAALKSLLTPGAYTHAVSAIELVETHVSWIVLTSEFAYKIKRPVRYAFIDMRDMERRAFLCREELRLNRRFAPELYLEVCVITGEAGGARIGRGLDRGVGRPDAHSGLDSSESFRIRKALSGPAR